MRKLEVTKSVASFFIDREVNFTADSNGRISGERLLSCILRWEPVFQGERRKLILDRARLMPCIITRKEEIKMTNSKNLLKMVVLSMLIALGVVISPILRVEGMCPMAHFINIVCSVFLGPWYSLLCATLIGIIRMITMGIPPIALTGAIFGAFLSGVFYRISKGKIIFAVLGEIIGTGIIGAILSYPVMSLIWGKEGLSLLFYVPSFICGTLIGGSIAYVFLRKLADNGMLARVQRSLESKTYQDKSSLISNTLVIAAFGAILFVVFKLSVDIFKLNLQIFDVLSYASLWVCGIAAVIYYIIKKVKKNDK